MPKTKVFMPLLLALALASCGQQAVQTATAQPDTSTAATLPAADAPADVPTADEFDETSSDSVTSESEAASLESLAIFPWPTLSYGDSGWQVKAGQYLLNYHKSNIATDAQFGPATRTAVHNFQVKHGLPKTDKLDAATWAKLIVTVKLGDNNVAVKAVQDILKLKLIDGSFGPDTETAVYNFQVSRGLAHDKIVGPETWQALIAGATVVPAPAPSSRVTLAKQVLANSNIELAKGGATSAYQTMVDTANGKMAASGCHGDGNCGAHVYLDPKMLTGLLKVAQSYKLYITSTTGSGLHMAGSHHYQGRAVDIGLVNGRRADANNPYVKPVMTACKNSGAVAVLGPGDAGHATHVHCAW